MNTGKGPIAASQVTNEAVPCVILDAQSASTRGSVTTMRKRLAALALSIVLAVGLMPAVAFAADGGSLAVNLTAQASVDPPERPSSSWIQHKGYSSYEHLTVVYDGVPVGSVDTGKYLGEGIAITLDSADADYDYFTAKVSTTDQWPSRITTDYIADCVDKGETFYTGALEPNTTYYVWVATGNQGRSISGFSGQAWSAWSDPITVKTPAKKAELKANPIIVKTKAVEVSASSVKGADKTVKASKAFSVKKAQGKVTFKVTKYVTKEAKGKVSVSKGGKVTVKRGTPKGAYQLKVKVTATGNAKYAKKSKTVALAVTVK